MSDKTDSTEATDIEKPQPGRVGLTASLGLFNAFLDRVDSIAGERLLNWQLALSNEVKTFRKLVNNESPTNELTVAELRRRMAAKCVALARANRPVDAQALALLDASVEKAVELSE